MPLPRLFAFQKATVAFVLRLRESYEALGEKTEANKKHKLRNEFDQKQNCI